MLTIMLAVIYVQAESHTVADGQNLQRTLVAPAVSSEVAPLKLEAISGEVAETQSRNKRTPVLLLKKALLGGGALLGAGALGAGALGAGALGAGVLGAGILGAGAIGGGLYGAKQ